MKVALFVTCFNDTMFPESAKATVKLLERLGVDVDFPAGQTCCGQMHINTGYRAEALPLVRRYVEAFEAYDISALVSLLHEDATQCMPPWSLWLSGPTDIGAWHLGPGGGCRGSRMIELRVNGTIGFAQYKPTGQGTRREPWAVHLLEVADGRISSITNFVGPRLFAAFGLPERLEALSSQA